MELENMAKLLEIVFVQVLTGPSGGLVRARAKKNNQKRKSTFSGEMAQQSRVQRT